MLSPGDMQKYEPEVTGQCIDCLLQTFGRVTKMSGNLNNQLLIKSIDNHMLTKTYCIRQPGTNQVTECDGNTCKLCNGPR